jgi:hypothetical protein
MHNEKSVPSGEITKTSDKCSDLSNCNELDELSENTKLDDHTNENGTISLNGKGS